MDPTPILFVPILAGTWMFGLALFSFASHLFLTIVEETGNGVDRPVSLEYRSFKSLVNDGFNWSEDPFTDWLLKLAYIVYMGSAWFAASVLLGRAFAEDPLWRTAIGAGAFWIGFPFGMVSSLAAGSRWNPFWPPLFRLMFLRPVTTIGFYLFSLPLVAMLGITFNLLFLDTPRHGFQRAVLMSPVTTISLFLYARLLGRYAFVLNCARGEAHREPEPRRQPRPRKPKTAPKPDPLTQWSNPTEEHDQHPSIAQPEDLPPIMTPDEGEVTGYNIDHAGAPARQPEPAPRRKVHRFDGEEDDSPFAVNAEDDRAVPTAARTAVRQTIANPDEREIALYLRKQPTEPKYAYGPDLVSRLLNVRIFVAGVVMTFGIGVLAGLMRVLDALRPAS